MIYLLALVMLTTTTAPEVRLTTLDETEQSGRVVAWSANAVRLQTADGEKGFAIDQLLRVKVEEAQPVSEAALQTQSWGAKVELIDGSLFLAADYRSTGKSTTVMGALSRVDLEVPLSAVRSVQLINLSTEEPSLAAQLQSEWHDLPAEQAVGDKIVIHKPGSGKLRSVEGTIGDIGPERVQFTLEDGQTIAVNRSKVFGVIYFHGSANAPPSKVVVEGADFRLAANQITWNAESDKELGWSIDTELLGNLSLPAGVVKQIDYSSGRVLYLSDLRPLRAKWTPPAGIATTRLWSDGMVQDRGFYSSRLELEVPASGLTPEQATSAGIPQRVTFDKGLALRSQMELVYPVAKGFTRFRATAGIDPLTQATGQVELRLLGDGVELVRQTIRGYEAPVELECNVEGLKKLTIIVDFGPAESSGLGLERGAGDNLHLGNARLTK